MRLLLKGGLVLMQWATIGATAVGCGAGDNGETTPDSSWAALMTDGDSPAVATEGTSRGGTSDRYCSDCASVPLAYWKFDDCNAQSAELGDYASSTPISHPAFRAVSAACVAGRDGQAVQLSGGDDIVYSPDQPDYDFSQGLTVAAWVKPDNVSRTQSLVRKRLDGTSSFTLAIEDRKVEFVIRLTNRRLVGVTAPIKAGKFTHVAGTYDGQQVKLYINGSLAAQAKAAGTLAPGVGPVFIGNDATGRQFRGLIDEVWINNLAAPADTVKTLNCVPLPPIVTISPDVTPTEPANTPVTFDISVANPSDPAICPTSNYWIYASLPDPLYTDNYYFEIAVAPGTTTHLTADITAGDTDFGGSIPFQYYAYDEVNYNLQGLGEATFVLAPPTPTVPTGCASAPTQPVAPGGYYVNGNTICTAEGRPHLLHGLDRPTLEWLPGGNNISLADFQRMSTWNANVVRISLNQDFWLSNSPIANPYYPAVVDDAITWAEMADMDVILDLHWSDAGVLGSCSPYDGCQQLMPDVNSETFWNQVANRYKNDGRVMFELYNEPHDVSWDVWRNGGDTGSGWQAVGMQQLYDTVRSTGAQNLVLIGGLDWAYDLSGVPSYRIAGYNIVYASHPYGPYRDPSDWGRAWGALANTDPVIVTEFGTLSDTECTTDYSSKVIRYADYHNVSWTGWAWYPGGCTFPAVITDWSGTPSAVGSIMKTALLIYDDPPASPPLPATPGPDLNLTFDHQPQGWMLSDYADTTYTNLAAGTASGGTPPTLVFDAANGSPSPGSLLVTAPFTALDQYVNAVVNFDQPGLNLAGRTIHAVVRLVSGSLSGGGLQLAALTGPNWTWGSNQWVSGDELASGDWVPLTLDLSAVTSDGFVPSAVVQLSIQCFSGFSSNGGSFTDNGPVVLAIDTVTD